MSNLIFSFLPGSSFSLSVFLWFKHLQFVWFRSYIYFSKWKWVFIGVMFSLIWFFSDAICVGFFLFNYLIGFQSGWFLFGSGLLKESLNFVLGFIDVWVFGGGFMGYSIRNVWLFGHRYNWGEKNEISVSYLLGCLSFLLMEMSQLVILRSVKWRSLAPLIINSVLLVFMYVFLQPNVMLLQVFYFQIGKSWRQWFIFFSHTEV